MYSVMFVCHGNICRSAMAEFIFRDAVKKAGRTGEFFVASSAVSDEEIFGGVGNPVYPPARAVLKAHGISCEGKRAALLRFSDAEKYDLFACMDESNLRSGKEDSRSGGRGKMQKAAFLRGRRGRVRSLVHAGFRAGVRGHLPRNRRLAENLVKQSGTLRKGTP